MDTFYMSISTVRIGLIECQKHFATVNGILWLVVYGYSIHDQNLKVGLAIFT